MANTYAYSKAESDAKDKETFREIKKTVDSISAGEGGKIYKTVTEAENEPNKPSDRTIFQVEDVGYYAFDSSKPNGIRFVRPYYELEQYNTEIVSGRYVRSVDGSVGSLTTMDGTEYIPVTQGDVFYYSGSTSGDMYPIAGFDSQKVFQEGILTGGSYKQEKITVPEGVDFIIFCARNELYSPTPDILLKIEIQKSVGKEDLAQANNRIDDIEDDISTIVGISENFKPSKNLINPENIEKSYWNESGVRTSSNNSISTELIDVKPSTTYTLSGVGGISASDRAVFLDSQQVYISNLPPDSKSVITFTTPSNAKFVGITLEAITNITEAQINQYKESVMLEEGSEATAYESFGVKVKEKALPVNLQALPEIKLVGISETRFDVHSITERGDYLVHEFEKLVRVDEHDDGWYSPNIKYKGNVIIQGAFNWIHMIANPNEGQHVGLGHGCETFLGSHFFIDGKEINPSDIIGQTIEGKEFSFNWTSEIYAADSAATTGGSNVVPQQPLIVSTRHNLSGIIKPFSEIETRNKLIVARDNTTFSKCYIAMLGGYYPHLDRVQYENIENTVNSMDSNGVSAIAPSTALINAYSFDTADGQRAELSHVAKMWSTTNDYKVTQEVYNLNNADQHKMHIQATGDVTDFRKKLYWHPIITTTVASRAGVSADVFNTGDVIEGIIKRKITI